MHADAELAAEAAQCAHDQRRFWALPRRRCSGTRTRSASIDLVAGAEQLSLDMADFERLSRRHTGIGRSSQADLRTGPAAGVSATPTIFINGRVLVGALEYGAYEAVSGPTSGDRRGMEREAGQG